MAFSSGNDSGGPMSEINVTPLVDVMLVLLIIFMITAPLMSHKTKVELPPANYDSRDPTAVPPAPCRSRRRKRRSRRSTSVATRLRSTVT
ncbi:MAG: biopolymer transporter ExbD [Mycobacterium sp.]|nr:biopolymer transporter ExbD [Mycobacterium sp.]